MTLDDALDALDGTPGTVRIDREGGHADVDVSDVDRLGVRVREVRVHHVVPRDITQEATTLPERLRALPEPVVPIEVDPVLGGARLRSPPQGDDRDMFEVDVEADRTTIRRSQVGPSGSRQPKDFTFTREQLDRLIEQTGRTLSAQDFDAI
jgi:hypothetical protein